MPYTLLVILHRCLRNIDKREQEYLFPECVSRLHMLKLVIGGIFYKVNSFPESDNYSVCYQDSPFDGVGVSGRTPQGKVFNVILFIRS